MYVCVYVSKGGWQKISYIDISISRKKVRDTSKVTINEVAYELSIGTKIDDLG